jgi:hypothetical protein
MSTLPIVTLNLFRVDGTVTQPAQTTVTSADVGTIPLAGRHMIVRIAASATAGTLTVPANPNTTRLPLTHAFTSSEVFFLGFEDIEHYMQPDGLIHLTADQTFSATVVLH